MPAPLRLLALALLLWLPAMATAAGDPVHTKACRSGGGDPERPRIGLVLGGGGARGFAHVAVLKELERLNVPVDCIAGTSMGALVGGLYASGLSAAQIETELRAIDWPAMFSDRLDRPARSFRRKRDDDLALVAGKPGIGNEGLKIASGLVSGERVVLLLERLTQPAALADDFDALPIPFRAVATDLNTGQAVVIGDGNLAQAMRASMSIPGVFRPVRVGDKVLVDGGLANQVPVDVARAMGADIVIAVDVGTPLRPLDEGAGLFAIIDQISGFMTVGSAAAQTASLQGRDVLVSPPLGTEVGTSDFSKLDLALELAEAGLVQVRPRLAALSVGAEEAARLAANRAAVATSPPVVDFVRLDNRSRYADEFVLSHIDVPLRQPLDAMALERGLRRIHGLDTLDLVTYDLVEENGHTGLVIHVVPHAFGPNYLESGLSVYSDFNGDFFVNLRAGVLRSPVNARGGELRGLLQLGDEPGLLLDYYQPLDPQGNYFFIASASYESPKFGLFDADGERLANYRAPNAGFELALGREFSNYGAATLAYRRRSGRVELELGDPLVQGLDFEQGELEWALTYDRIDSLFLPRAGQYAVLGQVHSRTGLGAGADYTLNNFDAVTAHAIGKHSGFGGIRLHTSDSDGGVPVQGLFRLGGLTRFSGFRPNERLVENYALAYAGYTYELGRVLSRSAVLGGTIEYGRTWDGSQSLGRGSRELHGSVYFGFDSWLGPMQLGYGIREGGDGIFLLELGQQR